MNVIKTSQVSIVEFLKYVNDGQDHLNYIVDRKQSNCQSKRSYWITKKTSKRNRTLPWRRAPDDLLASSVDRNGRGPGAQDSIFGVPNDLDKNSEALRVSQTLEGQLASAETSNIKLLDVAETSNVASTTEVKNNPLQIALN